MHIGDAVPDLVHTAGLNAQIGFFAEIIFCAVVHIVI